MAMEATPELIMARKQYWFPYFSDMLKLGADDIAIGHSSGAPAILIQLIRIFQLPNRFKMCSRLIMYGSKLFALARPVALQNETIKALVET